MDFDKKNIGKFLKWIGQDVKKECNDELQHSGLEWNKQLTTRLQSKARKWFMNCGNFFHS